jgi:hypothetical protein
MKAADLVSRLLSEETLSFAVFAEKFPNRSNGNIMLRSLYDYGL